MDILNTLGLSDLQFIENLKLSEVLSQKKLQEPEAIQVPINYRLGQFNINTQEVPPLTLVANLDATHQIQLFNNMAFNSQDADKDDDGIIGTSPNATIQFDPNSPVLKYKLSLKANTSSIANFGVVNAGIKAGSNIDHLSYIKHQADDTVRNAVIKDAKNLPVIFSLASVKNLQPGEALVLSTEATMAFKLDLDASQFLAAGATAITQYLSANQNINLDFTAHGSLAVNFSAKDSFELIFTKTIKGKYKVSLKKASSSKSNVKTRVKFLIALKAPEKVSSLINSKLDDLMTAVTNLSKSKIQEVTSKLQSITNGSITFDSLSDLEQVLIEKLASRLNIPNLAQDALNKSNDLLKKIESLKTKLQKDITEAARQKLSASFGYEYSSITSDEIILQALLSENALALTHKDLVLMNTSSVTESNNASQGIEILEYLRSKSVHTKRTWGVMLGIGKVQFGGSDYNIFNNEINIKYGTQSQANKEFRITFRGIRGYEEKGTLGSNASKWWGGLDAQMNTYDAKPTMDQFDYSITLGYDHHINNLSTSDQDKIIDLVDLAGAWNIITLNDTATQTNDLLKKIVSNGDASNINFSFQFTVTIVHSI